MRIHLTYFLFLYLTALAASGQTTSTITYIANEGFMIEQAGKKVLIDGLFDNINEDWCDSPTGEMTSSMKNAHLPFDSIDIVLVSHYHRDHFNTDIAASFLKNSPNTHLICTKQTGEMFAGHPLYPEIKNRLLVTTPSSYSDTAFVASEIGLRIMRMDHSHYLIPDSTGNAMVNKHGNVENLGFIIDINGIKYFHSGDANSKDKDVLPAFFSHAPENIEVAFLDREYISRKKNPLVTVEKYLRPEYTFIMHLSPIDIKSFSSHFSDDPQTIVLRNKLDHITITFEK